MIQFVRQILLIPMFPEQRQNRSRLPDPLYEIGERGHSSMYEVKFTRIYGSCSCLVLERCIWTSKQAVNVTDGNIASFFSTIKIKLSQPSGPRNKYIYIYLYVHGGFNNLSKLGVHSIPFVGRSIITQVIVQEQSWINFALTLVQHAEFGPYFHKSQQKYSQEFLRRQQVEISVQ